MTAAVLVISVLLTPAAPGIERASCAEHPVRIMVASDLHYLAPELTDHGEFFQKMIRNGDGKTTEYCEELTDAFLSEVIKEQPDALILSGDLSFNGALQSHESLASKLAVVREAGIPVLVIPGNHDTNCPRAASFIGDSYELIPSVSQEDFRRIYEDCGFSQAVSLAPDSLSYVYKLRSDLWILMLDTSSVLDCILTPATSAWAEDIVRTADAESVRIISVTHQNLLQHHPFFQLGYYIGRADALRDAYSRYGVLCNLSGHMHIQHTQVNGFTEILTSSLSVPGAHYGLVSYDGETLNYDVHSTDVAAWAAASGNPDENLLNYSQYAVDFFEELEKIKVRAELSGLELPEEDVELLAATFAEMNRKFFTGEELLYADYAEGLELWMEHPVSFRPSYLMSLVE